MTALARNTPLVLHDIHADVWHAHALSHSVLPVLATGDAELDAQLPGGGWPIGALTEILQPPGVHSEWRLLVPALAQCGTGTVVLVGAPHLPFAPALAAQGLEPQRLLWVKAQTAAERLWACEQALRCAEVNAVLAWLPQSRSDQLRRLQMAAAEHSKLLFVMRPGSAQDEASPAALRLQVQPQAAASAPALALKQAPTQRGGITLRATSTQAAVDRLQVHLLKRRGPPLDRPLHLLARTSRLNLLLASSQAHALDCRTNRT